MTQGWLFPALIALVLWGVVGVLQKLGTNRVNATSLLIWVMVGYVIVIPLILWKSGSWTFSPTVLLLGVLAGCVNGLGTWLLFQSLESGAKASIAVPLTALYPAVTVLFASIFLSERLSAREWLGVALALAGGTMLSREREHKAHEER
jgi:transporter family protein